MLVFPRELGDPPLEPEEPVASLPTDFPVMVPPPVVPPTDPRYLVFGRVAVGATAVVLVMLNLVGWYPGREHGNMVMYHGWPVPAVGREIGTSACMSANPSHYRTMDSVAPIEYFLWGGGYDFSIYPLGFLADLFAQGVLLYFAFRTGAVLAEVNGWRPHFSLAAMFGATIFAALGLAVLLALVPHPLLISSAFWCVALMIPVTWWLAENRHRFDGFV